jgi:hypothetical protein
MATALIIVCLAFYGLAIVADKWHREHEHDSTEENIDYAGEERP